MRRRLVPLVTAALLLVGCAGPDHTGPNSEGAGPLVVVTTSILGDVVRNVVGETARVEVVMPIGADPHDFRASAEQVALLYEADLVIANGLGLEEGLQDALAGAEQAGTVVLAVAEHLDPIPFGNEDLDPHVWHDPLRMAEAVDLISQALSEAGEDLGPEGEAGGAAEYRRQIVATHEEVEDLLSSVPRNRRKLVTNHQSFGYLAERYDYQIIGAVIPGGSSLAQPSARRMAELVALIEQEEVPAVFAEATDPAGLTEAITDEGGMKVEVVALFSDSLGRQGSGAETYLGMLRTNARRIAEALG